MHDADGGEDTTGAKQFDVHPKQITSCKVQLDGGAADAFGPGGSDGTAQPAIDVKSLLAKSGEPTLEERFLRNDDASYRLHWLENKAECLCAVSCLVERRTGVDVLHSVRRAL